MRKLKKAEREVAPVTIGGELRYAIQFGHIGGINHIDFLQVSGQVVELFSPPLPDLFNTCFIRTNWFDSVNEFFQIIDQKTDYLFIRKKPKCHQTDTI